MTSTTSKKKYSGQLSAKVAAGDLNPAFEIFNVFKQRLNDRLDWVAKRMEKPFDFTQKDYYTPDRGKTPWPLNMAEADTLWEQKIKYDLLADRLAEKKEADPMERLKKRYAQLRKISGKLMMKKSSKFTSPPSPCCMTPTANTSVPPLWKTSPSA
ncbi:MAG: hypothetical protein HC904_14345 [Blastochloris sp.]|nr:hypothetical protein [Blastochloris sp.]